MAEGKRLKEVRKKVNPKKQYALDEACKLVAETASTKFDETVDIVVRLGVDSKKADQNVRGSVSYPHGLGKKVRVAVFAKGEKLLEAQEAGADIVGGEDLAEQIKNGMLDFDSVVATPDMMGQVGKIGKILGPRGLMPSPKVGTVTFDVGDIVRSIKSGRAEYRVDKDGNVHAPVGKASLGGEKIKENLTTLIVAINKAKPLSSKGIYLQAASLSLTMGPSIALDLDSLRAL